MSLFNYQRDKNVNVTIVGLFISLLWIALASNKEAMAGGTSATNPCPTHELHGQETNGRADDARSSIYRWFDWAVQPNYRAECLTRDDCPSDRLCIERKCQDPCPGMCGALGICRVISHVVYCGCFDEYGPLACGKNAVCEKGVCNCRKGSIGDPYRECNYPEGSCAVDAQCKRNRACIDNACSDPCSKKTCGHFGFCAVSDHKAECHCPDGKIGDPNSWCYSLGYDKDAFNGKEYPRVAFHCDLDAECTNDRLCTGNVCVEHRDYCATASCGIAALCENSGRYKERCLCPPRFTGYPEDQCFFSTPHRCQTDAQCRTDRACVNNDCIDPCAEKTCGASAVCQARNHKAECACPPEWTGDPDKECHPEVPRPCRNDAQCRADRACNGETCIDPCAEKSCGAHAACRARNHKAECHCPRGKFGDPNTRCYTRDGSYCDDDDECPDSAACVDNACLHRDFCGEEKRCGPGAFCVNSRRRPMCGCPLGMTGNPYEKCYYPPMVHCHTDNDCNATDICHFTLCRDACSRKICGSNAECTNGINKAVCLCKLGYDGDAEIECLPNNAD